MPSARSYENISTNGARHSKAHGIKVIDNLTFTAADKASNFKFEPSQNHDALLKEMLSTYGVEGTIQRLDVAGDPTGDFKLIWDYIDDNYSYYNTTINKYAVELAIEYAEYLQNGGTALTGVVAKYVPDGPDAGTNPDRLQSMHDNILGNLDINSIIDKFFDGNAANGSPSTPPGYAAGGSNGGGNGTADEVTGQRLLDAVFGADLDGRPYYSGSEGANAEPTIAWDVAHGLI
ncbi:MAG TPA: hypothetical protein VEZ20_02815 [Allosphingosinicella sp.]|jgi:hypothetical protein|nr:hypothetical protein [Allosphingosinicella sp.]